MSAPAWNMKKHTMKSSVNMAVFLGFLCVVLIVIHQHMDLSFGDAADTYSKILKRGQSTVFPEDGNIVSACVDFMVSHYKEWSSRSVIEFVMICVAALPLSCWHILDIAVMLLGAYSLVRLLDIDKQSSPYPYVFLFTALMMYPFNHMETAGWIATTINYSWVLAFGLYSLTVIKEIWQEKPVSKLCYVLAMLAAAFAMNQEQMTVIMLVILGVLCALAFYRKKQFKKLWPFVALNVLEFIWIAVCPGNAARRIFETGYYFPEYANYNLFDKIYLGFSTTMNTFLHTPDLVVTAFFVVLAVCVCRSAEKRVWKAISVVPVLYMIAHYGLRSSRVFDGILDSHVLFAGCKEGRLRELTRADIVPLLVAVLIAVCVVISSWKALQQEDMWVLYLMVVLVSVGSRVMLGFSASVYASSYRTLLFLYFGFIFMTVHLIVKNPAKFRFMYNRWWMSGLTVLSVILIWANYKNLQLF